MAILCMAMPGREFLHAYDGSLAGQRKLYFNREARRQLVKICRLVGPAGQ